MVIRSIYYYKFWYLFAIFHTHLPSYHSFIIISFWWNRNNNNNNKSVARRTYTYVRCLAVKKCRVRRYIFVLNRSSNFEANVLN